MIVYLVLFSFFPAGDRRGCLDSYRQTGGSKQIMATLDLNVVVMKIIISYKDVKSWGDDQSTFSRRPTKLFSYGPAKLFSQGPTQLFSQGPTKLFSQGPTKLFSGTNKTFLSGVEKTYFSGASWKIGCQDCKTTSSCGTMTDSSMSKIMYSSFQQIVWI